jgi:hypothetical protein
VVDGNYKTDHMKMKNPADDVWLSLNGEGYFVCKASYEQHLSTVVPVKQVNLHVCQSGFISYCFSETKLC